MFTSPPIWFQRWSGKGALTYVNYRMSLEEFQFQSRHLRRFLKVWSALIHIGRMFKIDAAERVGRGNILVKVSEEKRVKGANEPLIKGKLAV